MTAITREELEASNGASIIGFVQTGTGATAETVETALRRLPLYPEQYGAAGDGVTDDTSALQDAADAAAATGRPLVLTNVYKITAYISLDSDVQIVAGNSAAKVTTATANISLFFANGKSGIGIRGITFEQTSPSGVTDAYVGGVALTSCTDCIVEQCEFVALQWAGIYLSGSSDNIIRDNYFHDVETETVTLPSAILSGSADICVYRDSTYNQVIGNRCDGQRKWHGILVQDPYEGLRPAHNDVQHNFVGAHRCYGIVVYLPGTTVVDTYNSISNNRIEGITGIQPLDPEAPTQLDAGAGIYVVGKPAGGTLINANTIRNCCINTNSRSLAPGAIGLSGLDGTSGPVTITGNVLSEIAHYDGINVSTCAGAPVTIAGNALSMPSGNSTGDPIRLENASNVTVGANNVARADGGRCLLAYANGSAVSNINLSGLQVKGRVEFARASSGTFTGGSVTGLVSSGVANGAIPLTMASCDKFAVAGCTLIASNTYGMSVVACTNLRMAGNQMTGGFITSGTCTGSYFDKSNSTGAAVDNIATGLIVEQLASAAPASGTGAVGDRREQSAPAVGSPKGWRCTVAGAPGTWVSEGNL